MAMVLQDAALIGAGIIGSCVALVHGVLVNRLMVVPLAKVAHVDGRAPSPAMKLVSPLLQFSTFNWFVGGLALVAVGLWPASDVRIAVCLLVASSYLYGATANFLGTRGRHPGWMLYAVALGLIIFGVMR